MNVPEIRKLVESDPAVLAVLTTLGSDSYLVGGAIRDMVMGQKPNDLDFVANMSSEKTQARLKLTGNEVKFIKVSTINQQGTVQATHTATSSMIQVSQMKRGKDEALSSIKSDLSMRDFTMNAMAYGLKDGLEDPFNGMASIEQRVLALVNGEKTIKDSPIRLLRFCRFISTLPDFALDTESINPMVENAHLILLAPREMWLEEMTKLLTGMNVGRGSIASVP